MLCNLVRLFGGSSQVVELADLRDQNGVAVVNATVTARILDTAGGEVPGTTWPVSLDHTNDPPATYAGTIPASVALVVGTLYAVEIVAQDGAVKRTWTLNAIVGAA